MALVAADELTQKAKQVLCTCSGGDRSSRTETETRKRCVMEGTGHLGGNIHVKDSIGCFGRGGHGWACAPQGGWLDFEFR
jgi:hypothetical protein